MRIGFFGDVMGRAGRAAVSERLPRLRKDLQLDFVGINIENAAGGFGVSGSVCEQMFEAGADILTTGNHAYDQRDEIYVYEREERLLRPCNFPADNPGRGAQMAEIRDGRRVLVVNAQGQRAMPPIDDPCAAVERELAGVVLGEAADAVIIDFHAEATSEKYSMGHHLDGRASLVVGTHTHVPTADHQILPRGTAYITDLGMTGDYDSVIGMNKAEPLSRFTTKMPGPRLAPAAGEATLCGVYVETDDKTGLAVRCEPIRIGGKLEEQLPT
ncbi:MAG: TIGR00282 family metallophosphoesterase [Pseudomonadota bacterium]